MFTGLVEQMGKVESAEDRRGQRKLHITTKYNDLAAGESVSVGGVCLTVTEASAKGDAFFFVSEETLERTTLGKLEKGSTVNLERAMQFGGRMGGHWVQGHVDAKGMVLNNVQGDGIHRVTVALDPKYGKYCVEKGSITIDGVSLTINTITETRNKEFMVSFLVIPHTWKNTTISQLKIGDACNVEVDILAKYIERLSPQLSDIAVKIEDTNAATSAEASPATEAALTEAAAAAIDSVGAPETGGASDPVTN
jgi:riboflavin synthase